MASLQFQFYSLAPLPQDLRNLTLPDYPFRMGIAGPLPASVLEFFQMYQIVFYRDEHKSIGILCEPLDDNPESIHERSGFLAYRSAGVLVSPNLTMGEWKPGNKPTRFRKLVAKHGDAYAWMHWNKPVVVQEMTEECVKLA